VLLFQHLQDPDMSDATRAPTGKHQANPGPMRRGRRFGGGSRRSRYGSGRGVCRRVDIRGGLCEGDAPRREPKDRKNNAEYPETGPDRPW
jgi:hypothetical protein